MVRNDLPYSQKIVQSSHAAVEVARDFLFNRDIEHPSIIICNAKNLQTLEKYLAYYGQFVACREFRDNIFNNEITAFATEPIYSNETRKLFRKLQLIKGEC